MAIYHALIRTHHITSRKKVAALRSAAKKLQVSAVLRSGGVPGLMYVHGRDLESVQRWVDTVHDLRYKDYQLVAAPAAALEGGSQMHEGLGSLEELGAVKDLGSVMEQRGLLEWWRKAMGYAGD